MMVGCHMLSLYCDARVNHSNGVTSSLSEETAETAEKCRKRARKAGWYFGRRGIDEFHLCPSCNKLVARPRVLAILDALRVVRRRAITGAGATP